MPSKNKWATEPKLITESELSDLVKLMQKAFNSAVKSFDETAQRIYRSAYDQAAVDLIRMRNSKK